MRGLRAVAALALAGVGGAAIEAAMAGGITVQREHVATHPSQGEVRTVEGAMAERINMSDRVFVRLDTSGLEPGHAHTLWLVVINDPPSCEARPCSVEDVLERTDDVKADVGYGDGVVVGPDGTASLRAQQPTGPLRGGWFGHGLADPAAAELHLVVNDHGPVIRGRAHEMVTTYRGGCAEESIPEPFPASARAQGRPGPNRCRLVQDVIFGSANDG